METKNRNYNERYLARQVVETITEEVRNPTIPSIESPAIDAVETLLEEAIARATRAAVEEMQAAR